MRAKLELCSSSNCNLRGQAQTVVRNRRHSNVVSCDGRSNILLHRSVMIEQRIKKLAIASVRKAVDCSLPEVLQPHKLPEVRLIVADGGLWPPKPPWVYLSQEMSSTSGWAVIWGKSLSLEELVVDNGYGEDEDACVGPNIGWNGKYEVGAGVEPSEDDLADLSRACDKLWDLDLNCLVPGKDYEIDCGEGKKAYPEEDVAQGSLFIFVSDDIFKKPTFGRFLSLIVNYNPNQGSNEVVTFEERQEQASFIEEISRTSSIKYLHKYLTSMGITSGSSQDFKRMMTSLRFDLYGSGGTSGSSFALEHVFVGEIKQIGADSGLHN